MKLGYFLHVGSDLMASDNHTNQLWYGCYFELS